jgi:hypothetical protein
MPTREIPRSDWRTFFDSFSKQHEGWLTTIEVMGGDVPGDQIEAIELPFAGISSDQKGSEPDSVEITAGNDPSDEITHIVHTAAHVLFATDEVGGHEALEIEAARGEKTIVKFRKAAQPELLDDIKDEQRTKRAGGS